MTTILVVDDDLGVCQIVAEYLTDSGYAVLQASGCEDALATLALHPETALLLTDVRMPGCDGPYLAQSAVTQFPTLLVMLMTGYAVNGWPWPCLHKPFRMAALGEKVRLALDQSSSPVRPAA